MKLLTAFLFLLSIVMWHIAVGHSPPALELFVVWIVSALASLVCGIYCIRRSRLLAWSCISGVLIQAALIVVPPLLMTLQGGSHKEPRRNMSDLIDEKDEPGEYRDSVRNEVLSQCTVKSSIVTSNQDMVGTWRWHSSIPPVGEVVMEYSFLPSGQFTSRNSLKPKQVSSEKNKWQLNSDGTFSLFYWLDAERSTVRGRAMYEETRYFLRALADGRRVLWNGDGSAVLILERAD